jgi:hypothetical protein
VPETHQRLDPQRSANIYNISENSIVCPLHVCPIYPPSLCNYAFLLCYDGSGIVILLKESVKLIIYPTRHILRLTIGPFPSLSPSCLCLTHAKIIHNAMRAGIDWPTDLKHHLLLFFFFNTSFPSPKIFLFNIIVVIINCWTLPCLNYIL